MRKIFFIALLFFIATTLSAFAVKKPEALQQKIPILMYHHLTNNTKNCNTYTVHIDEFEGDIKCLIKKGYNFVVMKDLIDYVNGARNLPKNPIMITFDDGYLSVYKYAFETLKKHNAKAVFSIIGTYAEQYSNINDTNVNYAHATWDNLIEMKESGLVEIQNHTYNMHKKSPRRGILRMPNESITCYKESLLSDIANAQRLLKKKCNVVASTFVYPFGFMSKEGRQVVRGLNFLATLGCYENVSTVIKFDSKSLFDLGRYNRPSGVNFMSFMKKIELNAK